METAEIPHDVPRSRREGVTASSIDPSVSSEEAEKIKTYPKTPDQMKRLVQSVTSTFLFQCLEEDQMKDVVGAMFEKKVKKDEKIIVQGEYGEHFFVIESGSYDIFVCNKPNEPPKNQGEYNSCGSFGELALMYNTPRAATIVATSNGTLWCLDRATFRLIVLTSAQKKRKSFEDLLKKVPILTELKQYERMLLLDAFQTVTFKDNEIIIAQGQPGNEMYFIEAGKVKITMKKKGQKDEHEMTFLTVGDYFGELALLTKNPRAASAYAVGNVKLALITTESFERLLGPCLDIMRRNVSTYENVIKEVFAENIPVLRHSIHESV